VDLNVNAQSLESERAALTQYILANFHARSSDGHAFAVGLAAPIALERIDGAPYLVAHLTLIPPVSSNIRFFDIEDDVILNRIRSHVTLVSIRSDWMTGTFAGDPQLVGALRADLRTITIDRTDAGWLQGFGSIFHLGMRHIAEGTDHLLFLLALLLPAPLVAQRTKWAAFAGARRGVLQIVKVVSAFTLGHSVTLGVAALGLVQVPSAPIEVLIAVSILVSALHALRPIFPGREAWVAAFFGLIHGLAFATTLAELGLERWQLVIGLLAFNAGIETMQLIVVATTMPSLLLLSRTRLHPIVRIAGALFAATASVGWIAERWFRLSNPLGQAVEAIAQRAVLMAIGLFLLSAIAWWLQRVRKNSLAESREFPGAAAHPGILERTSGPMVDTRM
jgi:HupE / UreJ protein